MKVSIKQYGNIGIGAELISFPQFDKFFIDDIIGFLDGIEKSLFYMRIKFVVFKLDQQNQKLI